MNTSASRLAPVENNQRIPANWAVRATLLWRHRKMLARVTIISLVASLAIAFIIPKQYKATASIMPPDQQGSGTMMLAALLGRGGLSSLSSLAGGLLGGHTTTALFVNLLESETVRGRLIDRFNLQDHDRQAPCSPHEDHRRQKERCHHNRSRGHGSCQGTRPSTGISRRIE
jgi:hypothetical protein